MDTTDIGHCESAALLTALLIAPILLMTEKWATEQSCIHIEITSCKIPSLTDLYKKLGQT